MKGKMPNLTKWREARYKVFNKKIDHFKNHQKYEWLRKYADDAISANEGFGYLMVKGADFIERIEKMPLEYIKGWLDGENNLEWKYNEKELLYL